MQGCLVLHEETSTSIPHQVRRVCVESVMLYDDDFLGQSICRVERFVPDPFVHGQFNRYLFMIPYPLCVSVSFAVRLRG